MLNSSDGRLVHLPVIQRGGANRNGGMRQMTGADPTRVDLERAGGSPPAGRKDQKNLAPFAKMATKAHEVDSICSSTHAKLTTTLEGQ